MRNDWIMLLVFGLVAIAARSMLLQIDISPTTGLSFVLALIFPLGYVRVSVFLDRQPALTLIGHIPDGRAAVAQGRLSGAYHHGR